MKTKNVESPVSQETKVSSEELGSQAIASCCFPGNDASHCCSPYPSVQESTARSGELPASKGSKKNGSRHQGH